MSQAFWCLSITGGPGSGPGVHRMDMQYIICCLLQNGRHKGKKKILHMCERSGDRPQRAETELLIEQRRAGATLRLSQLSSNLQRTDVNIAPGGIELKRRTK